MSVFAGRRGELIGGRYRIDRILGIGGMAEVCAAFDMQTNRSVALKVPRAVGNHQRFAREMTILRDVSSPFIPAVLDAGTWDEQPFIAFELLDGVDLATWLVRRGSFAPAAAAEVVRQACCGVEAAHARGLVHRDLKPANLFVAVDDTGASIRVLDFGIAGSSFDERITNGNDILGSPAYMAPEQMRPSAVVGPHADVWALGVVLYEAIAGRTPFTSSSFPELCLKVMLDPPPPIDHHVPTVLWEVIVRCLAKEPADRFPSVAALREALEPIARDVSPFDATELELILFDPARRAARMERRRAWSVSLAAILSLVLVDTARTQTSVPVVPTIEIPTVARRTPPISTPAPHDVPPVSHPVESSSRRSPPRVRPRTAPVTTAAPTIVPVRVDAPAKDTAIQHVDDPLASPF